MTVKLESAMLVIRVPGQTCQEIFTPNYTNLHPTKAGFRIEGVSSLHFAGPGFGIIPDPGLRVAEGIHPFDKLYGASLV
jgi:hypothetical protein